MKRAIWNSAILAGLGLLPSASAYGQLAAFPGAVGYGAGTTGGRTGSVYVVTNLNNSGTGSFRDAVSQSNRIIVFAVSGYIDITSAISASSNLTILGQTAPGGGIGIYGAEVSFYGQSNDIVQYMRFRDTTNDPGGQGTGNSSGNDVNLGNTTNMIFDHDSLEFASYNNIDGSGTTGANNLTFSNSIIANPIPDQQFNFHWQGNQATFINNIFANSHNRSILGKGNVQFVNNSVYNYQAGFTTGNSSGNFPFDIVNNYFVAGPSTTSAGDAYYQVDTNQTAYASGNLLDGNTDGVLNGSSDNSTGATVSNTPLLAGTTALPTLSATASYAFNMLHSGDSITHDPVTYASSQGDDQVDQQVVTDLGSYGTQGRLYNSQTDTGLSNGGLGTITSGVAPTNTAGDGIADSWKLSHGLNVSVADSTLLNPVGYTMIEEYAAQMADTYNSQTWSASSGNWVNNSGNWSSTLPGDYDHALIRGNGSNNGSVTVASGNSATAYSLSIGGNGPSAGESVLVTGGVLNIYNGIVIGDQNNGTLQITGGTVEANTVQIGNTVWNANGSSSTTYTGTLNLLGGVLSTSVIGIGGGTPGNWNTGGFINWSGGTLAIAGTLSVTAPATLGLAGGTLNTNGGTGTISSVISGNGPLKVIGGGTITLSGTNTYTGVTTISNATVDINSLNNGGVAGPLSAATNAAGNLILDGGTLRFTGTAGASTDHLFTLTANGGTLDGSGSSGDGMGISNTGTIAFSGTGNRTLYLIGSETHNSFLPALGDADANSHTTVVMDGTGRWLWESKLSTYTGDTSIVDGTLRLYQGGFLPSGVGYGNVDVNSGGYLVADISTTINGLNNGSNGSSGGVTITSGTLTMGNGNANGSFGGVITGSAIAKIGSGKQILSGTNTYTGTTTITGGVLQFNTAGSIGSTGASVTVTSGASDAAGYAINQAFLARINNTSTGSAALAVTSANNLNFSSATGANLPNVSLGAVGSVSYTGVLTPYGTNYYLGGGGGNLTLPNVQLTGADTVTVTGPGIVTATGANTYTGITTILTDGIFAPNVTIGGNASGMGISSNAASNLILNGGTFEGSGTTDRSFTLTTLSGSIDNSNGLNFTGPGAVVLPANTNITLTLTGSNTGHNLFNLSLADSGSGYVTSVTKTGVGKWTFSADGTKTYSGPTTIVAGQLEALSGDGFSHYSDLVIDTAASLEMHGYNVTINGLDGTGAVYDSFVNGTRTLTIGAQNDGGNWAGNINSAATLNVVKTGTGTEVFSGANTYVGATTVSTGTLTLTSTGSLITTGVYVSYGAIFNLDGTIPATATLNSSGLTDIGANNGTGVLPVNLASVAVSGGGEVSLANPSLHANRTLLLTSSISFGGGTNSWQGQVDLGGNDLLVHNGSIGTLTNQVAEGYNGGGWNGNNGIISSLAASDTTHLTALGMIQNSVDGTTTGIPLYGSGTALGLFDGTSPVDTDVLAKYTYYGDANLDGKVDGSDYSRIDYGYLNQLTGWFNGDFNYDGVVDGSDYTLIDNAFNNQGAQLTADIAGPAAIATAVIAGGTSAVPEPGMLGIVGLASLGVLGRRRVRSDCATL